MPQYAAYLDHKEVLDGIYDRYNSQLGVRDFAGRTELHVAAACGQVEMTRLLLERGANGRVADANGYTAFHYAALHDNIDVLAVLMEFGAYTRQKTVGPMYVEVIPGYT